MLFRSACAAARQGVDVGYLSPFSNDVFGQALAARLAQTGAKALGKTSRKPTSLAVVNLQNGQPSYGFYREGVADRDYLAEDIVTQLKQHAPGVLHTGSLMAMPPEHRKVMHVIQFAKALGWTISIDVNLRTKVADDVPAYLQAMTEMAGLADWLKASDEDMQCLGWAEVHWDHTHALAAKLARMEGKSLAQVVKEALSEKLQRQRDHKRGLADRLMEIGTECARLPVLDHRSPDEIIGYDDLGVPR